MLGLILRLFDPVSGKVLIGGVDAREAAIADLRGVMGLVPQETALFTGTIADNIRFGRPDADFASLRQAAVNANADGFIMDMPQGYDTPIGEKGCGFPVASVSALPLPGPCCAIRRSCCLMKRHHRLTPSPNRRFSSHWPG